MNFKRNITAGFLLMAALVASTTSVFAADIKIAVTDLSYQERVSGYFHAISASSKSNASGSASVRENDNSFSSRGRYSAQAESNYNEVEGTYSYIDGGELRNYSSDLKGQIIKGGGIRLVQGRPYVGRPMEEINDIIGRIKQGMYQGADYVLFGTVSSIQFNQGKMMLSGSTTNTLTLDLVADYSLINTKTFEVKASFSASGSGADTKILSSTGDVAAFNRGKVISETSKSLSESAYAELLSQLGVRNSNTEYRNSNFRDDGKMNVDKVQSPVTVY